MHPIKTVCLISALLATTTMALPVSVTDWVKIFDGYSNATLNNADTASPSITNAKKSSLVAPITPVTLLDGDRLTLTGTMTVNGSLNSSSFRFGIYDAPDPLPASGTGDGYLGIAYYNQDGIQKISPTTQTHPFTGTVSEIQNHSTTGTYVPNSPVSYSLSIVRDGDDLTITASITQTGGASPFSSTASGSYTPSSAADYFFDTVALLHTDGFDNQEAFYSNIQIEYTPESSPISHWKTWNNITTVSSDLNTEHPTFGDGSADNADGLWYAGKFDTPVTLEVGEMLTVSATINLTGGVDAGHGDFRLGVYNDGGQFDATPSSGENWSAGYFIVPGSELYQMRTNGAFISTGGDAVDLNADKTNEGVFRGSHTEDYIYSMSITRDSATSVDIVSRLTRNESAYEQVYTKNNLTTSNFTFTTMGGSFGGSLNLDQATYSNARYQVSSAPEPEPGSEDSDEDGMPDTYEFLFGFDPDVDDAASSADSDALSNLEEYLGADGVANTGDETSPVLADTDGDGVDDDDEITAGTDPNSPEAGSADRLFGVDFNRSDAYASPSQSLFRTIAGSTDQASNANSYAKTIGSYTVTVSQPDSEKLEFRGANSDSTRAIPGGDVSCSFLVSDFIATRKGSIRVTMANLPAGDYFFRSYHLDSYTGAGFAFAQGSSTETPNTISVSKGGATLHSVQPTTLGSDGLNTTFISNAQVPRIGCSFSHDGSGPLVLDFDASLSNGSDQFLFLNGFELYLIKP
ncbi:hypothetical protein HW115_18405 [Verrucomicrobiaceae bacterium N1E253]|uniref:Uncharacterized protein n=1 Tax=Oceaniferula marina TaxID=2748318 RepID=A0A851GRG0_9BACT|nr:hypothetical protein [Oceaniferula marina]NWK57597.1 hypothetical protein [Oceaniferula marina]